MHLTRWESSQGIYLMCQWDLELSLFISTIFVVYVGRGENVGCVRNELYNSFMWQPLYSARQLDNDRVHHMLDLICLQAPNTPSATLTSHFRPFSLEF